jgi:hypothetical protein
MIDEQATMKVNHLFHRMLRKPNGCYVKSFVDKEMVAPGMIWTINACFGSPNGSYKSIDCKLNGCESHWLVRRFCGMYASHWLL